MATNALRRWKHQQAGRSKGGKRRVELGMPGHRWTSETARKVALRYWKQRKKRKRYPASCGRKVRRKNVKRQPLRIRYSVYPPVNQERVWCLPATREWFVVGQDGRYYPLSERAALRRLGHLPPLAGNRRASWRRDP